MKLHLLTFVAMVAATNIVSAQNGLVETGYKITPVGDPATKMCYTYAVAFSEDKSTVYISSIFCYEDKECPSLSSWALHEFNSRVGDFTGTWANVECTGVAIGAAPLTKDAVIALQNGKVAQYRKTEGKKVVMVQFPQCK